MVVYGIAACAVARLPFDRRIQTTAIMSAVGLALAKRIVKAASRDVVVGVERYYLGIEPGAWHRRRSRRRRYAA